MTDTVFHNGKITIRRTRSEADLHYVVAAELDEANSPYVSSWSFERHKQALEDEDMLHLIIEDTTCCRVGFAILLGASSSHGTVELLRLVITDKGRGYGKAVLQAVQVLAFEERSARRLWLDVRERNARARGLYESMGFKVEGMMRDACRVEGGYESLLIMSILSHEYERMTGKTERLRIHIRKLHVYGTARPVSKMRLQNRRSGFGLLRPALSGRDL